MPNSCCVPFCNQPGGFKFPAEEKLREKWKIAIRRGQWTPKYYSVVCPAHFKPGDFYGPETLDGLPRLRDRLKKDAVPSVFKWTFSSIPPVQSLNLSKGHKKIHIEGTSTTSVDMANEGKQVHNAFLDNSEPIAIDSDSDNSSDTGSNIEIIGDEDSNSNTNSNVLPQQTKANTIEKSIDDLTRQELKKLSLDAHGTFMMDFDPEKSKREIRKMNRRLNAKGSKRLRVYDEKGHLLEDLTDICDCLDKNCSGCHFPCPRCRSTKCGTDCRCNRKYTISFIELEGTDKTVSFPVEKLLPK